MPCMCVSSLFEGNSSISACCGSWSFLLHVEVQKV